MSQVITEFGGNDCREMLVLGNSVDFLFREIGEGQAVLDRNHGDPRLGAALQPARTKAHHPCVLAVEELTNCGPHAAPCRGGMSCYRQRLVSETVQNYRVISRPLSADFCCESRCER